MLETLQQQTPFSFWSATLADEYSNQLLDSVRRVSAVGKLPEEQARSIRADFEKQITDFILADPPSTISAQHSPEIQRTRNLFRNRPDLPFEDKLLETLEVYKMLHPTQGGPRAIERGEAEAKWLKGLDDPLMDLLVFETIQHYPEALKVIEAQLKSYRRGMISLGTTFVVGFAYLFSPTIANLLCKAQRSIYGYTAGSKSLACRFDNLP